MNTARSGRGYAWLWRLIKSSKLYILLTVWSLPSSGYFINWAKYALFYHCIRSPILSYKSCLQIFPSFVAHPRLRAPVWGVIGACRRCRPWPFHDVFRPQGTTKRKDDLRVFKGVLEVDGVFVLLLPWRKRYLGPPILINVFKWSARKVSV